MHDVLQSPHVQADNNLDTLAEGEPPCKQWNYYLNYAVMAALPCPMAAHLNALKHLAHIFGDPLPHVCEAAVIDQAQHVPQPPLPEEIDPVVHPAVGLGGAAYGVVHCKAKPALLGVVILHSRAGAMSALACRGTQCIMLFERYVDSPIV